MREERKEKNEKRRTRRRRDEREEKEKKEKNQIRRDNNNNYKHNNNNNNNKKRAYRHQHHPSQHHPTPPWSRDLSNQPMERQPLWLWCEMDAIGSFFPFARTQKLFLWTKTLQTLWLDNCTDCCLYKHYLLLYIVYMQIIYSLYTDYMFIYIC